MKKVSEMEKKPDEMTKQEYDLEVGSRLKYFRENYIPGKSIRQKDLLNLFGSRTEDEKATLINYIEHGKRGLTEKNIRILERKYGVQADFFRLKTDHMREEDELKAASDKHFAAQKTRSEHFRNIMVSRGFTVRYKGTDVKDKDGNNVNLKGSDCIISDKSGNSVTIDYVELENLINDFEDHLAFHIKRKIMQEADRKAREADYKKLLSLVEK